MSGAPARKAAAAAGRWTATLRLTLTHLAVVALSSALVLGLVYWSARALLESEAASVVEAELRRMIDDYPRLGGPGVAAAIERRLREQGADDGVYLLTTPRGARLAGNLSRWPQAAPPPRLVGAAEPVELTLIRADTGTRAEVRALAARLPDGARLLVGRDVRARADFDAALLRAFLIGLAAAALLAGATGWVLSRLTLRRVSEITAAARQITAGDMASRAPMGADQDEFTQLRATLNAMLETLDRQMTGLRVATESLAHDLRSPLTRAKHGLSRLGGALRDEADQRRVARVEAELDHALSILTAMLAIARTEAGVGRENFEPVDLARLAAELVALYEPVVEESGGRLILEAEGPVWIEGHAPLLSQALSNLLENAARHNAPGGMIRVAASRGDGGAALLTVSDQGPGIPAAARAAALEPFQRLDAARGGATDGVKGGAGLGLALVAAVARLHGAALTLDDAAPGLRVEIRLPAA